MTNKKKYYGLDEIGIVGKQEPKSGANQKYHARKTSEVFRTAKKNTSHDAKVLRKAF